MLKIILFICFLPFALTEIFFYKQFGFAVVGVLYFLLIMQADRAANRFLADSFRWHIPTRQSERKKRQEQALEEEEIEVTPLHAQPGQPGFYTAMKKEEVEEEPTIETPRPSRPSPFRLKAAGHTPLADLPKSPNYRGEPHEVLAVPENAATRTIKRAFRFWIKKVHPDHNAGSFANFQVRKITAAKELLLERRRVKKQAA